MNQRPTSITIISWFIILSGCFSLLSFFVVDMSSPAYTALLEKSPLPISVHIALGYFNAFVNLACGFGMLYGKNLARHIYVGLSALGLLIGLPIAPLAMSIFVAVFLAIFAFIVYRPKANAYFLSAPEK